MKVKDLTPEQLRYFILIRLTDGICGEKEIDPVFLFTSDDCKVEKNIQVGWSKYSWAQVYLSVEDNEEITTEEWDEIQEYMIP